MECIVCDEPCSVKKIKLREEKSVMNPENLENQLVAIFFTQSMFDKPLLNTREMNGKTNNNCTPLEKLLTSQENPSQWINFCESCFAIVSQAKKVYKQLTKLKTELNNCKLKLEDKVWKRIKPDISEYDKRLSSKEEAVRRSLEQKINSLKKTCGSEVKKNDNLTTNNASPVKIKVEIEDEPSSVPSPSTSPLPISFDESIEIDYHVKVENYDNSVPIVDDPEEAEGTGSSDRNLRRTRRQITMTNNGKRARIMSSSDEDESKRKAEEESESEHSYVADSNDSKSSESSKSDSDSESDFDPGSNKSESKKRRVRGSGAESERTCKLCNHTFASKQCLTKHMNTKHTKAEKYECQVCDKVLYSKESFKFHKGKHLSTNEIKHLILANKLECINYKGFVDDDQLHLSDSAEEHDEEIVNKVLERTCSFCKQLCSTKWRKKEHERVTHGKVKKFECKKCDKKYKDMKALRVHLKYHDTTERTYKCDYEGCSLSFTRQDFLDKHKSIVHFKKYLKDCPHCDMKLSCTNGLKRHIISRHTKNPPKNFKCDLCSKAFLTKFLLTQHLKSQIHAGENATTNKVTNRRKKLKEEEDEMTTDSDSD